MSAIREAQRQIFEANLQTTVARRPEQPAPAPARVEQSEASVQLSSRASEILASDRLGNFWNSTISTPKAADPADQYRSESKQPLEGYDQTKLDNPDHKTPKYIFGRVAQNFKLDSVQGDKAKAGELLEAMVPELQAAGLEVVGVSGDKIQVKTELGYEWVDVIRGAGATNPGWQWGSEGAGTPEPTATPQEWAAKTGVGQTPTAPMAGGAAPAGPQAPIVLGKQIDGGKVLNILRKYKADGNGLTQAVKDPELQKLYPGLMTFGGQSNGKAFNADDRLAKGLNVDKLFFPNGAIVDVIKGAGAAGADWGWMPEN
jgi:hypothetical protein